MCKKDIKKDAKNLAQNWMQKMDIKKDAKVDALQKCTLSLGLASYCSLQLKNKYTKFGH